MAAKYSLESLTRFLENPTAIRPDSRMPDLGLAPAEALDIAAHLVDFQESNPQNAPGLARFVPDPAKVAQGAAIYETLRCAACHEPDASSVPVPIRNRQGGCLALSRRDGVPFYDLSAAQRTALQMEQPFSAPHPIEVLNCLACHSRDGNGGPDAARSRYFTGDEALGDSGRLPPPLTGIGRKLRPEWMEGVFAGKNRIRPYVNTRMPVYAAWAKPLTTAFSPAETAPLLALAPNPDPSAGRKLLGVQGGVNCITCHQWGVRPSLGIQALDISTLGKRLRPEWFRQYLLDPASYRPGTLMPPLWPGGQSMIRDVLEGDTERQIASIWAFILKGDGIPEGFPDIVSGAFELIPKDRPIVQRAFLNGVGPQAILTGFPGGVNLAYNGETGRPAKMWRGRFFDAYSTWFLRAAPFEDPLGTDVLDWPGGSSSANQFLGYRLEKDGSPVFLNNVTGVPIEEHFEAVDGKLRRTLIWKPAGEEPVWTHPGGAVVTEAPESGPGHRIFFYHWKP